MQSWGAWVSQYRLWSKTKVGEWATIGGYWWRVVLCFVSQCHHSSLECWSWSKRSSFCYMNCNQAVKLWHITSCLMPQSDNRESYPVVIYHCSLHLLAPRKTLRLVLWGEDRREVLMHVMGAGAGPLFDNKEDLQWQWWGPPKGPDFSYWPPHVISENVWTVLMT